MSWGLFRRPYWCMSTRWHSEPVPPPASICWWDGGLKTKSKLDFSHDLQSERWRIVKVLQQRSQFLPDEPDSLVCIILVPQSAPLCSSDGGRRPGWAAFSGTYWPFRARAHINTFHVLWACLLSVKRKQQTSCHQVKQRLDGLETPNTTDTRVKGDIFTVTPHRTTADGGRRLPRRICTMM